MSLFTHNLKVLHAAHHKCGSTWISNIVAEICKKYGLVLEAMRHPPLSIHTGDFLYSFVSDIEFDHDNYVGSHMIRDPRDVIVSAWNYHKVSNEGWEGALVSNTGKTYHEFINSLDKSDGIHFEMRGYTSNVLKSMIAWNYNNPKILEVKYEDLILNPDENFFRLFTQWGIHRSHMDDCLEIARKNHITHKTGSNHPISGMPGKWKQHLDPSHKLYIKAKYGRFLIERGYEKDYNW